VQLICNARCTANGEHTENVCLFIRRGQLKCDGTREQKADFVFRLNGRVHLNVGASFQSTTGSRGVRISGSNAGYTMFRGSVNSTGYPLHSPVSRSLPLSCFTVCHHISTGVYRHAGERELFYRLIQGGQLPSDNNGIRRQKLCSSLNHHQTHRQLRGIHVLLHGYNRKSYIYGTNSLMATEHV
jgi:hypothetical protein